MTKRTLLVLSQVYPFPGSAGQEQRVSYTLQAARERFHVTFVTTAGAADAPAVREQLAAVCDEPIVLPSRYLRSRPARAWHRGASSAYALWTGTKPSNYRIGRLEYPPGRMDTVLGTRRFDAALFEYCHAADSARAFHDRGIPCILDMHDVLWQSRASRLEEQRLPAWWKRRTLRQYRAWEEGTWPLFDAIIAINRAEQRYVDGVVGSAVPTFYAPMGTDLSRWPESWSPAVPPRLAYYGGLGSPHNAQAALRCVRTIMPAVWQRFPDAEIWLVGSSPPESLRALAAADPRVKVTGYLEHVQPVLATMTAVLCPWTGTYGFRSRLVEVMALGVPVVVTPDATFGMELEHGVGVLYGDDDAALAAHALRLLEQESFARKQSRLARAEVVRRFSLDNTYTKLVRELDEWLAARAGERHADRHRLA